MRLIKLLSILIIVLFISCESDENDSVDQINRSTNPSSGPIVQDGPMVSSSFTGVVTDENGNAIDAATVTVGSSSVQTDANGVFSISDAAVSGTRASLRVEKDDFFTGFRNLYPSEGSTNHTEMMLLSDVVIGTVMGVEGGEVTMPNGSKVELLAGGVSDANGNAYMGNVNVSMKYIDPTTETIAQTIPGDLTAINSLGEEGPLVSMGMLAVELKDDSGNPLNVMTGSSATLTNVIPTSLLATAPETIAMWSFDETLGIWVEEGTATRVGNTYVGEVSHFSFWNWDVFITGGQVRFDVCLVDQNGIPYSNALVRGSFDAEFESNLAHFLDADGCIEGLWPKNTEISLEVLNSDGTCNTLRTAVGSFDEDIDLGEVIISRASTDIYIFNTETCDTSVVSEGYLKVNGRQYFTNAQGQAIINDCSILNGDIDYEVVDVANQNFVNGTFNSNDFLNDELTINICNDCTVNPILEKSGNLNCGALDSITLIASGGDEYDFGFGFSSNANRKVIEGGIYTVTVRSGIDVGCFRTVSIEVLTEEAREPIAFITNMEVLDSDVFLTTLSALESIDGNGGHNLSYRWSTDSSEILDTSSMLMVENQGVYILEVTDECSNLTSSTSFDVVNVNSPYEFGIAPSNVSSSLIEMEYNSYKSVYIASDGVLANAPSGTLRVIRNDAIIIAGINNLNTTTSEGIGYGMLMAAMMGDQEVFDGLHSYYNFYDNGTGLMSWAISSEGIVLDTEIVPDGDSEVAYALLLADLNFTDKKNYLDDAKDIIAAIKQHVIETGTFIVKPGITFGGSAQTNPSYFTPGYYKVWGEITNDEVYWNQVIDANYQVIFNAWNAETGLVPDWTTAMGGFVPSRGARGGTFSFDAIRIPWRIVTDRIWFNDSRSRTYVNTINDFVESVGIDNIVGGYSLDGTPRVGFNTSIFTSMLSTGFIGGDVNDSEILDTAYSRTVETKDNSYFGDSLRMLALLMMNGDFVRYE